jgi:hypothetical protein
MIVVASNWSPSYTPAELPPALADDLGGILEPLHLATLELYRTLYRYELLVALGQRDFFNKINGTTAAPPFNTVVGCINTAIVVSLCAFFDETPGAVNLRAILNRILRPDYADRFREFHSAMNPGFDVDRHRRRLVQMQRRLRRHGKTGEAIQRLSDLRNQTVAHLDTQPRFDQGYPMIADMSTVLASVAKILISVVRLTVAGRRIELSLARRDARLQALALCLAIQPVAPDAHRSMPRISA